MVSNASKELKQRVEVDKEIGAAEEEAEDARTSLQAASTWGRACQTWLCWLAGTSSEGGLCGLCAVIRE